MCLKAKRDREGESTKRESTNGKLEGERVVVCRGGIITPTNQPLAVERLTARSRSI
jgi:hypothetical protein